MRNLATPAISNTPDLWFLLARTWLLLPMTSLDRDCLTSPAPSGINQARRLPHVVVMSNQHRLRTRTGAQSILVETSDFEKVLSLVLRIPGPAFEAVF
jgi:hypothetical protein